MKSFIKTFSLVVIFLFVLSVFGWLSVHVSQGDKDFGFLNAPVEFMYTFLDIFEESVQEAKEVSPTFLKTPEDHVPINNLTEDLIVLTSFSATDYKRHVVLKNLRDNSVSHTWKLRQLFNKHDRVLHSMHFPNMDLVYSTYMREGLKRVDSDGNLIWSQDSIVPHHAMSLDSKGMMWVCTGNPPAWTATAKIRVFEEEFYYMDDYLTQVDPETGSILFHKSISEILMENEMTSYFVQSQSGSDPLHLNDIQPALKTTEYYNEGDLFVSLKQISLILQYRPSTGEVIRAIKGPFSAQHDIDFYNDSTLSLFNNNFYALYSEYSRPQSLPKPENWKDTKQYSDIYSNIVQYDLSSEEFSFVGDSIFRANKIFTANEGLHEFINDSTYFVEQQNQGYLWVIQNDKVIYKDVFHSKEAGFHHLPNWYRIIQ